MGRAETTAWLLFLVLLLPAGLMAQTNCNEGAGALEQEQPKGITTDEIIKKFSALESEFKEAQTHYAFIQDITVQTLEGEDVDGEFRRVSNISFNGQKRIEYVTFAPQPSLRRISMEKEDFEDLNGFSTFFLTRDLLSAYNLMYVGRQKVDQIGAYVFDLAPKQLEKGRSYFQGRIWVDDRDFEVVKTCGKSVRYIPPLPKKKKKRLQQMLNESVVPTFVTYREAFEGKYWFPTYVRTDEKLHFLMGDSVHVREVVKFSQFKRADISPATTVQTGLAEQQKK